MATSTMSFGLAWSPRSWKRRSTVSISAESSAERAWSTAPSAAHSTPATTISHSREPRRCQDTAPA